MRLLVVVWKQVANEVAWPPTPGPVRISDTVAPTPPCPGTRPVRVRSASAPSRLLRLEKSHFVKQISVLVHLYRIPCALISKASATFKHQGASRGPRVLAPERARWPAWRRLLAPRGRASPTVCPGRPISSFPQGESAILIPRSLCLFILRVFDCSDSALTRKT